MKMLVPALALATALASAEPALAWTRKAPVHPTAHSRVLPVRPQIAGPQAHLVRRPHSPNPAWDVYRINGRYVGSDPDPRVRLMLRKDRYNEY
jgi:hypothetical protein